MNLKTFLVIACAFNVCAKMPEHVKCTDVVTKGFCQKMSTDMGVIPIGQGGFFLDQKVRMVYADFERVGPLSEQEAKEVLYAMAATLIAEVNQSALLKDHLFVHPIGLREVSLSVAFLGKDKKPLSGLSQIHLYEGKIHYSSFDASKKQYISYNVEDLL